MAASFNLEVGNKVMIDGKGKGTVIECLDQGDLFTIEIGGSDIQVNLPISTEKTPTLSPIQDRMTATRT